MDRLNAMLTRFAARVSTDMAILRHRVDQVDLIPGPPGPQGATGSPGAPGLPGVQGVPGPVGPAGLTWRGTWNVAADYNNNDAVYYNGASYYASGNPAVGEVPDTGGNWVVLSLRGLQGAQGAQGVQGVQGIQGVKGDAGIQGVKGDTGIQGVKGDVGIQGIPGVKGDTGPQGIQGIPGVKGDAGDTGPQGIQGLKGDTGAAGTSIVSTAVTVTAFNSGVVNATGRATRVVRVDRTITVEVAVIDYSPVAEQSLFTLPAGYVPYTEQFGTIGVYGSTGFVGIAVVGITTDRVVKLKYFTGALTQLLGTFTFESV